MPVSDKTTPMPWVVNRGEHAYIKNPLYKGIIADLGCAPGDDPLYVCNPDDRKSGPEQWLPNAELICRAVNAHDDLVAALQAVVDAAVTDHDACSLCGQDLHRHASGCVILSAKAALAKAEPKA
jgi:hypothetical protein